MCHLQYLHRQHHHRRYLRRQEFHHHRPPLHRRRLRKLQTNRLLKMLNQNRPRRLL
jgi:hypothetical protein